MNQFDSELYGDDRANLSHTAVEEDDDQDDLLRERGRAQVRIGPSRELFNGFPSQQHSLYSPLTDIEDLLLALIGLLLHQPSCSLLFGTSFVIGAQKQKLPF